MPSFGFDSNGTYLIDINIPQVIQSEIQIAFLNKKQYIRNFFKFFPPSICDLTDVPKYNLNFNNHILQGQFDSKIDLYPFLLRCYPIYDSYDLPIITEYRNPTTCLDNRMVNGIYGEMFIFILHIVVLLLWTTNWIYSTRKLNFIQNCITATIVWFTISHIVRFFELKRLFKTDETKLLTNFRIFFNFLSATFCCFFFLLCSEGFCILTDTIPNQRIITFFIVSSLFSGCLFLTYYYDLAENFFKIVFLDMFCFIFYGYELFEATKRANVHIESLLLSAADSANSQNYASLFKNKQYKLFQRILIVVLCSVFFCLVFRHFSFLFKNWLIELFVNLIELSIVVATAVIFRPMKKNSSPIENAEISSRLIIDDNEDSYSVDDDGIPLNSIDSTGNYLRNGPTPDQPLLQQEQDTKSDKKSNGNKFTFI